ncbi:MAG: AzlC family ABC transporter permease [Paracoccaceae bacterium]|nr:AzlC family ABC transporter permease [Paracoccaceae bacterium]
MTVSTGSLYWRGFRNGLPFILVIVPFGLLFGVVATEAGLPISQVMGFSVIVIAGAAQFAAVQLMQSHAPTLIVIATALAINLRMAMYSASMVPHLGAAPLWQRALISYMMLDQTYATSIMEFERVPDLTSRQKVVYYVGAASPIVLPWYLATWAGATVGTAIPSSYALDFAIPITFLAMIAPMLRTLPQVAAALVSITLSLIFSGLPYNLGLLLAAPCAMITGAQTERWQMRRRAQWI